VGIVDSREDRNELDNKSKTYQGYREKMAGNTTEDLKWIQGPQISVRKCSRYYSQDRSLICVRHYVQSYFGGVISLPFLMQPRVYPLC